MGPAADIPLRYTLTERQVTDLEQWLRSITPRLEGQRGDWWPLSIKDGGAIGLPCEDCSEACAFGLTIQETTVEEWRADEQTGERIQVERQEEREQYLASLGYIPQQSISIYAGCNRSLDHRILGHLALLLAERYDGIIDLDGAIRPPLKPGEQWDDVTLDDVQRYIHAMPGRILDMYYTTRAGKRWVSHIVDTTFLRAWLQHPDFHMIK